MKYLKLFSTHEEYTNYIENQSSVLPNVSFCIDNDEVHYNEVDYSRQYFTIKALETGNVYFKYHSFATTETQRYMEYSKDGGETWTRTNNVDDEEITMTIPLTVGEIALVRGDNDTLTAYDEDVSDDTDSLSEDVVS
jgi:hypothetical protein